MFQAAKPKENQDVANNRYNEGYRNPKRFAGGEYFGIAAYEAAMEPACSSLAFAAVAEKFQGDHKQHAQRIHEAILGLGGVPIETKTWDQYASEFPPPPLTSQDDILRYAASLEGERGQCFRRIGWSVLILGTGSAGSQHRWSGSYALVRAPGRSGC